MLKTTACANAAAVVTAGVYMVCLVLSQTAPDFLLALSSSWIHAINLESLKTSGGVSLGSVIWGFASSTVFAWLVGYAFAWTYNRFAK